MNTSAKSLRYILPLLFILAALTAFGQQKPGYISSLNKQNHWVDSVYKKLSRKQRVAQLFFVRAHTNLGQTYEDSVGSVIKDQQVGGLVFFQGGPGRQLNLINTYQKLSKVPLLVAMDGEWGLGMRLDSVTKFPYQLTLGALSNDQLVYQMGRAVGDGFLYLVGVRE